MISAYVLGGGYLVIVVLGVILSIYLILRHVQLQFNLQNVVGVLASFCNLLGYIISTSLIALSILLAYPISQSLKPILIGHTGFMVGFFFFSLSYTSHLHKVITTLNTYKELHVLSTLGVLSQLVYLTTFLATPNQSYLVRGATVVTTAITIVTIVINLFIVVLTYRSTAWLSLPARLGDDEEQHNVSTEKLTEDVHARGEDAAARVNTAVLMCFVTVNIVFLVKSVYDVFGITLPVADNTEKFDVKVFLITYTLIYVCGLLQELCHLKLLKPSCSC